MVTATFLLKWILLAEISSCGRPVSWKKLARYVEATTVMCFQSNFSRARSRMQPFTTRYRCEVGPGAS